MKNKPIHPYAIYDSEEAANLLGVEPITIRRYIRDGKIVATKLGKVYRIPGQSLLDLMSLDTESVKTSQGRVRKKEESNYVKSKSYLLSHPKGKEYLALFDLTTNLLVSLLNPDLNKEDEDQMTLKYIGCRVFNSALAACRDTLSGYYQISFTNQRDLVEIQFLVDYFRSFPKKISEWRNASNQDRYNKFSPAKLRTSLDKRDGFKDKKREKRYKMFCEYAAHVSYPGIKLLTNEENEVEIGPFYNESKLLNCIHELCLNYGHVVMSLAAILKVPSPEAAKQAVRHMEKFDHVFNYNLTRTKKYKNKKKKLELLVKELENMQGETIRI